MKRGKLKQSGHLLAAILILVHGFSSYEDGDFKAASGYLCVAVVALLVAGLHKYFNRNFRQSDAAFFLLESVTLFYSAWEYREDGKFALSYFITAAGIGYFVWAFFTVIFKDMRRGHQLAKHKSRRRNRNNTSSAPSEL